MKNMAINIFRLLIVLLFGGGTILLWFDPAMPKFGSFIATTFGMVGLIWVDMLLEERLT